MKRFAVAAFTAFGILGIAACSQYGAANLSSLGGNQQSSFSPTATPTSSPKPVSSPSASPTPAGFDLQAQVETYTTRYGLHDPYTKLVDNEGNGYDALYGVRNFRMVLQGIYYRGGANNAYNKYGTRNNEDPLPILGLQNLCTQGFSNAIYLYTTNFSVDPATTNCKNVSGLANTLTYQQLSALSSTTKAKTALQEIYDHITGKIPGPLYAHCWNGWHASGYLAAIALKQFCGWSGADAASYWVKNTDGVQNDDAATESEIEAFTPYADLQITSAAKALICPQP